MLAKNTRASVATVAVALITGLVAALLLALMPAPAQAQSGDVLRLLSIKAVDITHDEGGLLGDFVDEPYIKVDGVEVWSGRSDPLRMKNGDVHNLTGVSATLSGQSARVQLWESDPGTFNRPDDGPAEFFAEFTGGDERTRTLTLNGGVYEIQYVVDRAAPLPNTNPEILDLSPAPGSELKELKPLISATVRDAETDLSASNIKLFVDGNGKTFAYDRASDKLTYQSAELAEGQHTVRVEATDEKGLKDTKEWSFRIVNPAPNTAPTVVDLRPAPGSKIKNRAPLISATVQDAETDLDGTTIKLFLDGSERTASYDRASDKLTYQSAKLVRGQHTVKVEATDASGLKGENSWSFKVVRR